MTRLSHTIVLLSVLTTPLISLTNGHQKAFVEPKHHHDHEKRQLSLCPVPCGQGWCCVTGQKCTPVLNAKPNSNPFECDDPILQITWEAYQGGYISSLVVDVSRLVSSLESVYSTTFDLTTTPTIATRTSTTSPDQGSGPITLGFGPTRTTSTTATSTNNAAARPGGGFGLWDRGVIWGSLLTGVGVALVV